MVKYKTADGQRLVFPPCDDVGTFLNAGWYEFREIAFFYRYLRKGDRFLDVGAHCGLYSAIAKGIVGKSGYVLAIEPSTDIANYLLQNLNVSEAIQSLSDLRGEGCEWLRAAAMESSGSVYLSNHAIEKSAYREVSPTNGTGEAVPAFTGDQVMQRLGHGFDLIKIDVEGVERLVLEGLRETLKEFPDTVLMIEFTQSNQSRHQGSTEALAARIQEQGLGLYEFDYANCRLVECEDGRALEHRNLFACRQLDEVNRKLQSTPQKQKLYAEEVIERGRASEDLYSETLLFKIFRAKAVGWLGQIAASLRHLRGDSELASNTWEEKAKKIETTKTGGERASALAALIEDGLGQLEGTSSYLAESLSLEREKHEMLKSEIAEAEAFITRDLRLESPSLEVAIRAGMEALASDILLLKEVKLALPAGMPEGIGRRLEDYSIRIQHEMSDVVINKIGLQRLKAIMIAASEQLREAKSREANFEAALSSSKAQMESRQVEHEAALADVHARLASREEELQATRCALEATEVRVLEQAALDVAASARANSLTHELTEAQRKLVSVEAALQVQTTRVDELESEISRNEDELAIAASEIESEQMRSNSLESEVSRLNSELALSTSSVQVKMAISENLQSENSKLKIELALATSNLQKEREKIEASLTEASALEARLSEAAALLRERDLHIEQVLEETDLLFSELSREHEVELNELRAVACEAKAVAYELEPAYSAAHEELAKKSAQLSDVATMLGESAREIGNFARDAQSDHKIIRDLVHSVRASRVVSLAAALGIGPRRSAIQMIDRTSAARAKIVEILLRAGFLKGLSGQLAQPTVSSESIDALANPDEWSVYESALELHARDRRGVINQLAREDLQAIGRSIDALRRSRLMKLATIFRFQVSRELKELHEVYNGNSAR